MTGSLLPGGLAVVAAIASLLHAFLELTPVIGLRLLIPFTCYVVAHYTCTDYYDSRVSSAQQIAHTGRVLTVVVGLLGLIYWLVPDVRPFDDLLTSVAVDFPLVATLAILTHLLLYVESRDPVLGDRVLILGMSPIALRVAKEIRKRYGNDRVKLTLLDGEATAAARLHAAAGVPVIGSAKDLPSIFESFRPTGIVVALGERRKQLPTDELLACRARGIRIESGVQAYERLTGKLAIEMINPGDLIFSQRLTPSRMTKLSARATSATFALIGATLTAPAMLVIAILIRLTSAGPVLFVQERVGYRGRPFRLLKFRTMLQEKTTTSEWAIDNLDRITPLGYWLRKFRLDELPQFWNILRGDMNFVGPRPHPTANHPLFEREIPYYSLRSMIRPGLTGWAQIRNGYANDLAGEIEKMRYDLYYIEHQSLWFDFDIVLKTVRSVVFHSELESEHEDILPSPIEERRRNGAGSDRVHSARPGAERPDRPERRARVEPSLLVSRP